MENTLDRKDLKIIALKERISILASQYEDQDADRRVEITVLTNDLSAATARIEELEQAHVQHKKR